MSDDGCIVVVGGTAGIGKELARYYAAPGARRSLTGRDAARRRRRSRPRSAAGARASRFDLAKPKTIARRPGRRSARSATWRSSPSSATTTRSATSTSTGPSSSSRSSSSASRRWSTSCSTGCRRTSSIVLFGGQAKDRPYPGSTTVSTVNGGISGLARTLVGELAPIRVNAIHPGITGDSPFWHGKPPAVLEGHLRRRITKKLATMDDIVDGTRFLLENPSVEGYRPRRRQRTDDVLTRWLR